MGVLNVTPDSFSDGGRFHDRAAALSHGRQMVAEGADIIDVGGESTRPGAEPVDAATEIQRIVPVIEALSGEVRVSVDTRHAEVAEAAVAAGATLINDVSATLWEVAAATGAGWVAMHMQGEPGTMQAHPVYDDVVVEVRDLLVQRAGQAAEAGVSEIWIDPGIGFGKTPEHNLALLADLEVLVATGLPVVVGASRKSSLGLLLARSDAQGGHPSTHPAPASSSDGGSVTAVPVDDRLEASLAVAVWAASAGAAMLRVHDVHATERALRVVTPVVTAEAA
jgi:dihydropteroate synthase